MTSEWLKEWILDGINNNKGMVLLQTHSLVIQQVIQERHYLDDLCREQIKMFGGPSLHVKEDANLINSYMRVLSRHLNFSKFQCT